MKDKFGREKPVHQKKIKAPTKQCNTLLQVWHFATEKPELQRRKKAGPLTDPSMFDKENKDLGTHAVCGEEIDAQDLYSVKLVCKQVFAGRNCFFVSIFSLLSK